MGSFDGVKAAAGRTFGPADTDRASNVGCYNISREKGDSPQNDQPADCDKIRDPVDTDHFSRFAYRRISRESNSRRQDDPLTSRGKMCCPVDSGLVSNFWRYAIDGD